MRRLLRGHDMSLLRRLLAAAGVLVVLCLAAGLTSGALTLVSTFGTSMAPRMAADDLVVVRSAAPYDVGDVVAYRSPELGQVVLHRIVDRDRERFVFRGDNNDSLDPERLPEAAVLGKEILHIPRGGTWLRRLTSPPALAAYAFLFLTVGGATVRTRRRRRKELRLMSSRPRTVPATVASLHDRLKPVAAGAALVGLTGLALGGVAWTKDTEQTVQAADGTESSMTFGYTAEVRPSAAYDDTTVTAPQPVFRKLADAVDVTYRYAGPAGQLRVTAELSSAAGWTSSVPLGEPVQVDEQYAGVVTLDLASLEERAQAAAAVTGMPSSGVTVAVVPTVELHDGGEFAPRLELRLDPLVLTAQGELTATGTTSTTGERRHAAQLGAFGHAVDVWTVRALGGVLVVLGLLTAAAVAAASGRIRPDSESERVRRRHSDLVLPVLPVALTAGRPVVDVPDVDSLVRLAERYGLLVLTWSRGGMDTYVVQDEGTSYRYRSGTAQTEPADRAQDASTDVPA